MLQRHRLPTMKGWVKAMTLRACWIDTVIVLLAVVLRSMFLELKPPHFDEGVNGWFVDQMTRNGFYHYDPENFHGPLHFYVEFVTLTLFGRHVWVLRLPIVVVSTLCVALVLAYRRYLPARACRIAAVAMAISPGGVFYGRYAIHESWLLFFLLLAVWGLIGLWHEGGRGQLWATGLGLTGMVLTKETYFIHWITLLLAAPTLLLCESLSPSAPFPIRQRNWSYADLDKLILVATLLIFFFYTGGLLDWSSLGLVETFARWMHAGTGGESGHEKSWHYFLELIARYEWPALLGMGASLGLVTKGGNRLARYLAIYGLGALTAYSLVPYKTPWCVIVLLWPFHFLFGLAAHRLLDWLDGWVVGTVTTIVCTYSLLASCLLNFRHCTDEEEPYVYVQTLPDIRNLLDPLNQLTAQDSRNFHLVGHVLTVDHHPLIWLLGDFTRVEFFKPDEEPSGWDGAFLLVDESLVEKAESNLTQHYFKQPMRLRGSANNSEVLYLNESVFGSFFPGRKPEFATPPP
jgi:uncharacterized protein (TIGR03663 family)